MACVSLPPAQGATKPCRQCGEVLPLSRFPFNRHGNPHPDCHPCTYETRKAARASRPAWQNAHADWLAREQEARRIAKEYRQAQREAERVAEGTKKCPGCLEALPLDAFPVHKGGKRQARCKPCWNAYIRARYHKKMGRSGSGAAKGSISPERKREAAERIAHLVSQLHGTDPSQRICSQEGWDMAVSELQRLWLQSGDKECVACKATVPPSAIRPPGPANFYTGKCNDCAHLAWEANHRATYGPLIGPLPGPPKLRMKDGTSITVAQFARRVREREQAHRR